MRVTGGSWGGRRLSVPRGRDVRPTSDRVREALFAILQSNDFGRARGPVLAQPPDGATQVLDACAGTGALGIEALSRGAAHAIFFDMARGSLDCIRENLVMLGAGQRAVVRHTDTASPPRTNPGEACDLVFLDPPYASDVAARALPALAARGWFADEAIVVIEHAVGNAPDAPAGFTLVDEREYGETALTILRYDGTDEG